MRTGESTRTAAPGRARGTERRPLDLLAALTGVALFALMLLVVAITAEPTSVEDAVELRSLLPPSLLTPAAGLANIAVLLLIGATAVERLISRAHRQLVRALAAAGLGYGLTIALNTALTALAGDAMPDVLNASNVGGVASNPLHAYLAAVIGYARAARPVHLSRVAGIMAAGIAVTAASVLLSGYTTPLALLLTLLVGWVCAAATAYAVGTGAAAPATDRLARELARFGLEPLSLGALGGDPEGNQRFVAETVDRRLDVVVLKADTTNGVWKRLFLRIALRDPAAPPVLLGLRRRVEHTALLEYAAGAAEAATPRLLAVGELDPTTAVLVREHVRARPLADLADTELTEEFMDAVWRELRLLHRHRIAHRNIHPGTVALRADGRAMFTSLSTGSVIAGQLAVSLDTAALITTLALRVGPERAVDSAVRGAGTDTAAATLPFLQSAGLPLELRRSLRADRGLLGRVRGEISRIAPDAPARPAKVERMRPRTVVSVAVATVVGLVLAYQLTGVDWRVISDPDPGWTGGAFALSLLCMVAPALALTGFSPVRLPLRRTVLVQYAASFIRIATPAGVGSLAVNTRYLTRAGATGPQAVAAVGVSQLAGLITHVPLLVLSAYLAEAAYPGDFAPSLTLLVVIGVLSVLVAAVLVVPPLRRAVLERARPYVRGMLPQLLDLLQQPRRMVLGVGGTLLLTVGLVLCLYASVAAFGATPGLAAVAVVFLAGNAIGSAAPSPGGLGAVEAALIGGLTAVAGVPAASALSGVLLFRLLTFWIPVLPGWTAFNLLQRAEAI
nr:lysylphosphatidylglycerol synthase transmembrane domain-containing protein [Actinorugispora endophytica]